MDEVVVPPEFQCPIAHEVMQDPVFTSDGQTYEKVAIQHWFNQGRLTSPVTGLALESSTLMSNIALKSAITRFVEKDRPRLQARAREHEALRATSELCVRQLREMANKASRVVPCMQYEHASKRLRLLQPSRHTSDASAGSSVPRAESYDALVEARLEALNKQQSSLEESRTSVCLELEALGETSVLEARTKQEDKRAALLSAKALALQELVSAKEVERDAKGRELVSCLVAVGIETAGVLDALLNNPAAAHKGSIPLAYAKLHCKCLALHWEQQKFVEAAFTAESIASECRQSLSKHSALTQKLSALDAKFATLSTTILQTGTASLATTTSAAWAHHVSKGSIQADHECLPMLAEVHQQVQEDLSSISSTAARSMKEHGFVAEDLKVLGITPAQLRDAQFTAKEIKEAGCTLQEMKEAQFPAKQLKEVGFTLVDLRNAGFTARECKECGILAGELKEAGFTLVQLKEACFPVTQLKEANFSARSLMQVGCSSASVYEICSKLTPGSRLEGLKVMTMGGYGELRSRDNNGRGPWLSAVWHGFLLSDKKVVEMARLAF